MESNQMYLNHVFHADLSDRFEGEEYWLQVAGKKYPLVEHTEDSLRHALSQNPRLQSTIGGRITHYTETPVPRQLGSVLRISVRHTNNTGCVPGDYGVHHAAIHIVRDHEVNRSMALENAVVFADHIDYVTTAKTLLFHHADIISKDPDTADVVMEHMDQFKAPSTYLLIQDLATKMRAAGPPTQSSGWATYQDFNAGDKGMKQTLVPSDLTMNQAGDSMTAVQISTKNDTRLQAQPDKIVSGTWNQASGTSVQTDGSSQSDTELLESIRLTATGDNWTAALSNSGSANGLESSIKVLDSTKRQVEITMNNYYIRWLGAYIQFIDADGNAMSTPTWQPDDGGLVSEIMQALDLNYDNMRFIGWMSPINTAFAIPISADPGQLVVKVTFPENAVSANIYGCGIGTGSNQYPKTPVVGGVFTGLANLGIPTLFLGLGVAAQTYKPLYDLMGNKKFIIAVVSIGVTYFGADFIYNGAVNKKMDWKAFSSLLQILFTQACTKALLWCEAQIVEGEIEDEIPFAGWIMLAINIATTLAQLAETIVEVSTSPWMIPNSISTTITSSVTVFPDPRHNAFPQPPAGSQVTWVAKMMYKDQNRPSVTSPAVVLDPMKYPASLNTSFTNTLGGKVKFQVDFYIGGWNAGTASTSWLENDETDTANITLYLLQQPIPLDKNSIYKHSAILGYQNNAYAWLAQSTPPNATLADANNSQSGNAISIWSGLALSQRYGMLGPSWKAAGMGITDCSSGAGGQLFAFQNENIPGTTMSSVKFPSCGFSAPSQLVYDVFPPKFEMKNGTWVIGPNNQPVPDPTDKSLGNYYVDPRKADNSQDKDGGYHLRKVDLSSSAGFNMSPNQNSFGRFPFYPDSMILHPGGFAIGVNQQFCKLMITPLQSGDGVADDQLPLALSFAGQALNYNGSDGRPGLLFSPIAVACSYDGTILILEQIISEGVNLARIQAFDLNGNPVNCFNDASGNKVPFLTLPANVTYLDMAAVGDNYTTYIYALYYYGAGSETTDYNMTIYQYGQSAPAGNMLVTTNNVPAAHLAVDMWHTMYTLNYQMTQDGKGNDAGPSGGPGTGPAGITVPSVSEWLPPIPS